MTAGGSSGTIKILDAGLMVEPALSTTATTSATDTGNYP
jgi:hypothetical protein